MQFVCLWCCVPSDSIVHINNFFSLVLLSAVIHKKRGKKLNCKIIKYKLDSSSEMQFVFFYPKYIQIFFLENYRFRQKSGNDPNSRWREGGSCSLRHYDAVVRKSVCDSPLTFQSYLMFMVIISSKAIDQSLICRHFLVIYWNIFLFLLTWNNFSRSIKLFLWTTDHFLCNVNFFFDTKLFFVHYQFFVLDIV